MLLAKRDAKGVYREIGVPLTQDQYNDVIQGRSLEDFPQLTDAHKVFIRSGEWQDEGAPKRAKKDSKSD